MYLVSKMFLSLALSTNISSFFSDRSFFFFQYSLHSTWNARSSLAIVALLPLVRAAYLSLKTERIMNVIPEKCGITYTKVVAFLRVTIWKKTIHKANVSMACFLSPSPIKEGLRKVFKVSNMREPKSFLGMKIDRDCVRRTLRITQAESILKVLSKFGFQETKRCHKTPMDTRKTTNQERRLLENDVHSLSNLNELDVPYREAVGSLLYLAGSTRPDISFAVNILTRHQVNPTLENWNTVRRVFRYLNGTRHMGLLYTSKLDDLIAFSDASFADCKGSISTCGYILKLFGDTVAWRTCGSSLDELKTKLGEYE